MTLAAEVVVVSAQLRAALLHGELTLAQSIARNAGFQTAWEVALQKIAQGLVDPRDAERRLGSRISL